MAGAAGSEEKRAGEGGGGAEVEKSLAEEEDRTANLAETLLLVGLLITLPISLGCILLGRSNVEILGEWLRGQGSAGMMGFGSFTAIWVCVCLPVTTLEVIAGFVFVPQWRAWLVCLGGQMAGNLVSFAIGRLVLRDCLYIVFTHKISWMRGMKSLMRADGGRNKLFYAMVIAFSYSPLYIHNYCLAALPIGWHLFFASSLISSSLYALVWAQVGSICRGLVLVIELGDEWRDAFQMSSLNMAWHIAWLFAPVALFALVSWSEKTLKDVERSNRARDRKQEAEEDDFLLEYDRQES